MAHRCALISTRTYDLVTQVSVIRNTDDDVDAERSETRGFYIGCSTTNKSSVFINRTFTSSSDIVLNGLSLAAHLDHANSVHIPTTYDIHDSSSLHCCSHS